MRIIHELVLENLVYRPHSQISMRIISLSLFHKSVETRVCGSQSAPDAVFWLNLVSVHGSKIIYSVEKQLHNGV